MRAKRAFQSLVLLVALLGSAVAADSNPANPANWATSFQASGQHKLKVYGTTWTSNWATTSGTAQYGYPGPMPAGTELESSGSIQATLTWQGVGPCPGATWIAIELEAKPTKDSYSAGSLTASNGLDYCVELFAAIPKVG
jgi:hypothetical protein